MFKLCVDEFSGNFSFIYLQRIYRVVPNFTHTNPEVFSSFSFLCSKFMLLLQSTLSSGNESNIPVPPALFLLPPLPSPARKVEHGEQIGVMLLLGNSLGSAEGLRGTICGCNTGEGRCLLETRLCYPPQR